MTPLVIWRFSDGKAGHDQQSRGLIEALARLRAVETVETQPLSARSALIAAWREVAAWRAFPDPDLVVGAGHGTHLSLLATRRRRGGKAVVLMQPSLPLRWFDLCLIPEHDSPLPRPNVLATRGALNRIRPSDALDAGRGLLLIGGPSAHFGWDDAALYRQIAEVLAADPGIRWTLTTSRRTPPSFLAGLNLRSEPRLNVVPVAETGPDWLLAQLACAGRAWVTADSVSMVYEALTAGAAVGVFEVPAKKPNRIGRGLEALAAQGWIAPYRDWRRSGRLTRPSGTFDEADRCARWIVERWFA